MSADELNNELAYYFIKQMLKDLKQKSLIGNSEYEEILSKIKVKYEPYFDLISD